MNLQLDTSDAHYVAVKHASYSAYDEYLRTGELAALNAWIAAEREKSKLLEIRQREKQKEARK